MGTAEDDRSAVGQTIRTQRSGRGRAVDAETPFALRAAREAWHSQWFVRKVTTWLHQHEDDAKRASAALVGPAPPCCCRESAATGESLALP